MNGDDSGDENPVGAEIAEKENTGASDGGSNREVTLIAGAATVEWKGPIPPPDLLEEYNRIEPGLANRIVEQATVESDRIHELQKEGLKAVIAYDTRGQWMAFFGLLAILGVSAWAIEKGAGLVAGAALFAIAGIAAVFVRGKANRKDRKTDAAVTPRAPRAPP